MHMTKAVAWIAGFNVLDQFDQVFGFPTGIGHKHLSEVSHQCLAFSQAGTNVFMRVLKRFGPAVRNETLH